MRRAWQVDAKRTTKEKKAKAERISQQSGTQQSTNDSLKEKTGFKSY